MTSSFGGTLSSTARVGPIGFPLRLVSHPGVRPSARGLVGGWIVLATFPLLWSWFALALRMP